MCISSISIFPLHTSLSRSHCLYFVLRCSLCMRDPGGPQLRVCACVLRSLLPGVGQRSLCPNGSTASEGFAFVWVLVWLLMVYILLISLTFSLPMTSATSSFFWYSKCAVCSRHFDYLCSARGGRGVRSRTYEKGCARTQRCKEK